VFSRTGTGHHFRDEGTGEDDPHQKVAGLLRHAHLIHKRGSTFKTKGRTSRHSRLIPAAWGGEENQKERPRYEEEVEK